MSYGTILESLVTRHLADQKTIQQALTKAHRPYSLAGLINSALREPVRPVDYHELETVTALNDECRAFGEIPLGVYVPLAVLANTRDLNVGVASQGGALVNPRYSSELTELLRPVSIIAEAGATIISGMRDGALILPAQDGVDGHTSYPHGDGPRPEWIAESGTAPQSEPVFKAPMIVTPRTVSVEVRFTRQLLKTSSLAVEQVVRKEILTAIMAEIDRVALVGNGVEEPLGLFNMADPQLVEIAESTGAIHWSHLVRMESWLSQSAKIGRSTFVGNGAVLRSLRHSTLMTERIMPDEHRLLGRPLLVSQSAPHNLTKGDKTDLCGLVLGDFSDMIVCFWGPSAIDLLVDGVTKASQGIVRVIGRCEVGIGIRRKTSFVFCNDIVATI